MEQKRRRRGWKTCQSIQLWYVHISPLLPSHNLSCELRHKIAELYRRGWDRDDLAGLTGGNLLRVMESAEEVARKLQLAGTLPVYDLYKERKDIPRPQGEL